MTGLVCTEPSAFWSEDVWTLTMPVLPHLVVTRIDCESRMHTVFSSCFGSVGFPVSVQTVFETAVMEVVFGVVSCEALAWTLHNRASLDPAVFRVPC